MSKWRIRFHLNNGGKIVCTMHIVSYSAQEAKNLATSNIPDGTKYDYVTALSMGKAR